jgi:hypothetical protein
MDASPEVLGNAPTHSAGFSSVAMVFLTCIPNRFVGMDYRSLTGVLFLGGLPSGDACVFPSFDDLGKNGAPGGRSRAVVVGCRCPSPSQG